MIEDIKEIEVTNKMMQAVRDTLQCAWCTSKDKHMQNITQIVEAIASAIQASTQIQELIAENKRLREENEWKPIRTAPKNGDWIIVWAKGNHPRQVGFSKELQQWVVKSWLPFVLDFEPTLWRPVPQLPKEQK